jgi:hypothetical protein
VRYSELLALIGRIHPGIWDAIIPHGPRVRVVSGLEQAGLNPQPLPPREAFFRGAAEMAHEVTRVAVATEENGGGSSPAFVSEIVDGWCGTPWPRTRPWPWPGPRPGTESTGPHPEPWDIQTARVIGAVIFASMASRLSEGDLRAAFAAGADRLAETALSELPSR